MIENLLCGSWESTGQLVLRLTLAAMLWPHGAQKVLGWFGGSGWTGTYSVFTQKMGIPAPLTVIAMLTEFLAPLGLAFGFMTRLSCLGVIILMLVAMKMNIQNGFFMNWIGNQKGEGIEYHLLYIGGALALCLMGPGAFSLDALLFS